MTPARNSKRPIPVESYEHKDPRVNIPTEELRDFVAAGRQAPKNRTTS